MASEPHDRELSEVEQFGMWLTTRPMVIAVGGSMPVYDVIDALKEWRASHPAPAPSGVTSEMVVALNKVLYRSDLRSRPDFMALGREALEAALAAGRERKPRSADPWSAEGGAVGKEVLPPYVDEER